MVDQGSKHGTFLNGEKVERHKLQRNDRLEFGARDIAYLIFNPLHSTSNTAREFLSQISGIQIAPEASDLEKLTLFMEAARKLNTIGVLDEILMTLLDATLKLTRAERGYIFLKDSDGTLTLAAGRTQKGEPLLDDKTISRSVLDAALKSNSEYLVTDTSQMLDVKERQSIVAFDLRTVICVPLRKPMVVQTAKDGQAAGGWAISERIQQISKDILRVQQGSLYPALHRLESRGWIKAKWRISENNRRARYYEITRAGRKQLDSETRGWHKLTAAVSYILGTA